MEDLYIAFYITESYSEIPEKVHAFLAEKKNILSLNIEVLEKQEAFIQTVNSKSPDVAIVCADNENQINDLLTITEIPVLLLSNHKESERFPEKKSYWVKRVNPENMDELFDILLLVYMIKNGNRKRRDNMNRDLAMKIFNSAQELIVITQGDHLKYFNSRVKEFYNITEEELLTGHVWDFIHPDDVEMVKQNQVKRLRGESDKASYQFRGKNGEGKIIWFRITGFRISWEGEPATLNFLVPIDEQKRAEAENRKTRKFLDDILEYSPDGIILLDENRRICRVNRMIFRLFGMKKQELEGRIIDEFPIFRESGLIEKMHLSDQENDFNGLAREFTLRNGEHASFDVVVQRVDHTPDSIILWFRDVTEKNKMLKIIETSEKKYRNLHENMHEGAISIDRSGCFIECNSSFLRLTRYNKKELSKVNYWEMTSSAWRSDEEYTLLEKLWPTGLTQKYEKKFITKDGYVVMTAVQAFLRYNAEGEKEGFWLFVRDITEEKRKEREVHERELKYRTILEYSPIPLFSHDYSGVKESLKNIHKQGITDLRVYLEENREVIEDLLRQIVLLDCNNETLKFFGVPSIKDLQQKLTENINNLFVAIFIDVCIAFWEGKNVFETVVEASTSDVNINAIIKWVLVPGHEMTWDLVLVTITDLSERIKYEKQLKVLSSAVDHSPASVVITDRKGNIEYVNPKFTEVTGYTPEEAIGSNPRILKSGNLPDSFYKTLWHTITQGNEWRGEFENKKKNGELFWELASISGIKNEKGEIVYYVAIKEDITERKKAELELTKAKERAEESDRLKTAFLANMSHEIRTPLNAIIGFANILQSDQLEEKQKEEYFSLINLSSQSLLKLIDDIIDVAKIEAKHIRIASHSFDLNELLDELYVYFQKEKTLHKGQVRLLLTRPFDQEFRIVADAIRVKQVLSNLLGNAIKFTKKGSVEFGYSLTEKKTIKFFVKDTGVGVPEDKQKVIFDRFRQVDDSYTREFSGTGLGLWISKNLAELMGGDISVESEEGKGSTFYFVLPLQENIEIPGIVEKKTETEEEQKSVSDWSTKKVLIAEDNESNFEYLKAILSVKKAVVIRAMNGLDVLEKVKTHENVDVVLMDIQMPELNGYEATRLLKKMYPDITVIAQTAFAMSEDRKKALDAGCDGYIAKPIQPHKLITLLEKFMGDWKE
ncbi:MAG: PAS domain S-box protein [Bacteroidales bacterium]|nr:PAS domain S-box protein [Bacteroidales bacterium]